MTVWLIIENICTLAALTLIAIFAPGYWKFMALATLLNINSIRPRKREND